MIKFVKYITRDMIQSNRDKIFLFGDNLKRVGMGGQAKECRGEPNSFGIPTKHYPSMRESAFFSDEKDYEDIKELYDHLFDMLEKHIREHNTTIVIPENGIGTGLSQLDKRAPKIYHHLNNRMYKLREI